MEGTNVSISDAVVGTDIIVVPSGSGQIVYNDTDTVNVEGEAITFTAQQGENTFVFTLNEGSEAQPNMQITYLASGWDTINNTAMLERRIQDAEVKITPEAIIGTVISSQQYSYDLNSKADLNLLNQFINEVEDSFTTVNTNISDVQLTAEDLTVTFSTLRENVEVYEGDLRVIEENLNANFRFSEDGFQIWRNNSDFNIRIDNEEMGFYQGDQKVAYVNNSKLYITSAQVVNDLSVGRFTFNVESNGSLSVQYT